MKCIKIKDNFNIDKNIGKSSYPVWLCFYPQSKTALVPEWSSCSLYLVSIQHSVWECGRSFMREPSTTHFEYTTTDLWRITCKYWRFYVLEYTLTFVLSCKSMLSNHIWSSWNIRKTVTGSEYVNNWPNTNSAYFTSISQSQNSMTFYQNLLIFKQFD